MGNSSQNLSLRHYHTKTLPFLFILLIAMINLSKIYSKTCKESSSLSETDCFNRILYLIDNYCLFVVIAGVTLSPIEKLWVYSS